MNKTLVNEELNLKLEAEECDERIQVTVSLLKKPTVSASIAVACLEGHLYSFKSEEIELLPVQLEWLYDDKVEEWLEKVGY